MKIIFVSIWLLGSIALFSTSVFSQSQQHSKNKPTHNSQRGGDSTKARGEGRGGNGPGNFKPDYSKLKTELGLTDAQVDSLKSIDSKFKVKGDAVRNNKALNEEDKKVLMKDLRIEKETALKKILTNDQFTKFKANRGHGRHSKRDYEKLKTDLALTDKQVESLKTIDQQYRTKAIAIRNNSSLDENSKKASMKSLRQEKRTSVKSVLTEEQYTKLQAKKKENCSKKKG